MLNGFKNPGRIALIGANSDIGLAIVSELPHDSARELILVGRTGDYGLDVRDASARERLVAKLFSKTDIDLVIIAIGVLGKNSEKSEADNLLEAMEVNYVATVHLMSLIAQRMKNQSHGTILVISSFAQVRPRDDNFGYGSTKAGLDFYARGLAASLQGSGVKIRILRPGFVTGKMTQGMKPAPFTISAQKCGTYGVKALNSKSVVTWAPPILRFAAVIFKVLPATVFRKITAR